MNHSDQHQMSSTIDDNTLRLKGIEALNKALGHADALLFLSLIHRESTDCTEVSRQLYDGQSVDEIYERAQTHC